MSCRKISPVSTIYEPQHRYLSAWKQPYSDPPYKGRQRVADRGSILQKGCGLFSRFYGECSDLTLAGSIELTINDTYPHATAAICGFTDETYGNVLTNCVSRLDIKVTYAREARQEDTVPVVGGWIGRISGVTMLNCAAEGTASVSMPQGSALQPDVGGLIGAGTAVMQRTNPSPYENKEPELVLIEGGGVPAPQPPYPSKGAGIPIWAALSASCLFRWAESAISRRSPSAS